MAEFIASDIQTVSAGQNVQFSDNAVCGNRCIVWRNGSGIVTLRGNTQQCRVLYRVSFGGNIAIPEGGTVEAITAALSVDGEALASATATVTPAAVENYFNIFVTAIVEVPRGCCATVGMKNTSTQAVNFANSNMTIDRIC